MSVSLHLGDCRKVMAAMPAASVDSVVTDAPYELGFMGRAWDRSGVAFDPATWTAALHVAKPGAHLVAFGGTRTHHRLTCAIEDSGWEIRDCLLWLHGQGFPKSLNGAHGGTALKPAWEPIVLARKPLAGTVAATFATHGTAGLNIDGCRVATDWSERSAAWKRSGHSAKPGATKIAAPPGRGITCHDGGRWPANVVLDDEAAALLGEQSRFFYCAKASRAERGEGNDWPTVKPLALMRWLCRLVTPKGGTVLDLFHGSGSTLLAARVEGFDAIGIDKDPRARAITERRLADAAGPLFAGGTA